jgi:hypothetical protein
MRLCRIGIKLTVCLVVAVFFAMMVGDARAQVANAPLDNVSVVSEKPQRTPTLVVHEIPTPLPSAQPGTTTAQMTQGAPSKNAATKSSAAGAPSVVSSTPPIVLPAGMAPPHGEMVTTGNPKYDELIAISAARNGVDPNLITAVMRQESGFNSRARSYKGATGLMQLMPGTAQRFGVTNIFDPAQNIEGGARYLRFLLDSFNGDVDLALAGYNAGENAVVNSGYKVPRYRETRNYVRNISARYDASKKNARHTSSGASSAPAAAIFSDGVASSRLSNNY